ncbi:MAG TPA: L-threonylcarbamoyladenylate synthase [Methanomassiliicoccales archaeon]|nr:L-threonylcarbamoyladenylate synthase [Methanomassiliicoccales archaeon]
MEVLKCKGKGTKADLTDNDIMRVKDVLKAGHLVVYPTETLYGLGANALDENAVKRVYMAKNRPFDMPLSVAVSDMQMLEHVAIMDQTSRKLAEKFMPGPITLILTKKPLVPDIVTSASDEVGIRMPDNALALRLIKAFGPITSTSANLHSRPDPVTVNSAMKDLKDAVSLYIDCGKTKLGVHSTIVAVHEGDTEIIRHGAISDKQIEAALNGR